MSAEEKLEILRLVECSPLPTTQALGRPDLPASTYYRWPYGPYWGGGSSGPQAAKA